MSHCLHKIGHRGEHDAWTCCACGAVWKLEERGDHALRKALDEIAKNGPDKPCPAQPAPKSDWWIAPMTPFDAAGFVARPHPALECPKAT